MLVIGSGLVSIVRSFSSDTIFPRIVEFVELNLNSFTLMLRFSEPTSLPVIVTSLTLQATQIGGTNYTLTGGSSAYDSSDPLRIIISLTLRISEN